MNSKKNKIIFSFICFVLYTACSFVPFLKSFTLLKVFFILPAFLYAPVYSIGIGIASYVFLLIFSIIKFLPYLNKLLLVFFQIILRNSANVLINILFVVLASLIIYFFKKRASKKGIDISISIALIIAVIISFLELIVSVFNTLIISNLSAYFEGKSNIDVMNHSYFYIISMIFTFIAVMISYFIYIKIKDKPFFSNMNNLNKENNVNNINE